MSELPNKQFRLAIVGGSSQVGASLAYYYRRFTHHLPVCFVRSSYSQVFFELLDIPYERIDLNDADGLKNKLKDFDAVLDFGYPSGQLAYILKAAKENAQRLIAALPPGAVFINMSSIMAYGMPDGSMQLRNYRIPRATYGFIKRQSEKAATAAGRKARVRVYNFRLGQVHGFLQSVNMAFREDLSANSALHLAGNPNDLTNTIFISTLGESIAQCIVRSLAPATYTLVSSPQWTLRQLYEYYITYYRLNVELIFAGQQTTSRVNGSPVRAAITRLKRYRPLLETYVLLRMPSWASAIKGKYREMEVSNALISDTPERYTYNLLGSPVFPAIENIVCDPASVMKIEKEMEAFYLSAIEKAIA